MKIIKWMAVFTAAVMLFSAAALAVILYRLPPVAGLVDPEFNLTIQAQDWQGSFHPFVVGPKNPWWIPAARIPPVMKRAVIIAEDADFYRHKGIDLPAVKEAISYNLAQRHFARGASTITQQTAKNLFLTRERTLLRKIKELYLARRMEQYLSKDRILELYLNCVELGPEVYGIGHGARYYFARSAGTLSPRQCTFLAAILPGPQKIYNPYRNLGRVLKRSDTILRQLRQEGTLSEAEYRHALAEIPDISGMQKKVDKSFSSKVKRFFKGLFDIFR